MKKLKKGDRVLMLEADSDEFSEFIQGHTLEIRTGTVTGNVEGSDIEVHVDLWSGTPPRASSDHDGELDYTSYYPRADLMLVGSDDVERVARHLDSVAQKLRGGSRHPLRRPR